MSPCCRIELALRFLNRANRLAYNPRKGGIDGNLSVHEGDEGAGAEALQGFRQSSKAEVIRDNMTADFLDHDGPGGKQAGIEGDEAMMRGMYAIFPDLRITIDEMIAERDKVVCRNRWAGTNAKTGRRIEFHGFVE